MEAGRGRFTRRSNLVSLRNGAQSPSAHWADQARLTYHELHQVSGETRAYIEQLVAAACAPGPLNPLLPRDSGLTSVAPIFPIQGTALAGSMGADSCCWGRQSTLSTSLSDFFESHEGELLLTSR